MSFWFYLFVGSAVICSVLSFWSISRYDNLQQSYVDRLATCGLTGYEVARILLNENGLNKILVEKAQTSQSAAFKLREGKRGIIQLPPDIFEGDSLRAVATSAQMCGYALKYYLGCSYFSMSKLGFTLFWISIVSGFFLLNFSFIFLNFIGSEFFLIPLLVVILGAISGVCYLIANLRDDYDAIRRSIMMLEVKRLIEIDEISLIKWYLTTSLLKSVSNYWLFASIWNFAMAGVILCHNRSILN